MRPLVVTASAICALALLQLGLALGEWWTIAGGVGAATLAVWTFTEPDSPHDPTDP